MDNPVIPMTHPFAGEDCSDKVKIVFGEETIDLTEFGTRLCDEYGGEIQIGESKRLLIDCLRKIEEFLSIILNDGCFDASYQLIGSKILDRILSGDRFYDEVKFLIGEEEIALMQLKRYLLQDMFPRTIVINGENWAFRSILNTIQKCLREYEKAYEDLYKNQAEEELRKKREELKRRLLTSEIEIFRGNKLPFYVDDKGVIQHKEEIEVLETYGDTPISLKGDRLIGTSEPDEILSQIPDRQQADALDDAMRKCSENSDDNYSKQKREELRRTAPKDGFYKVKLPKCNVADDEADTNATDGEIPLIPIFCKVSIKDKKGHLLYYGERNNFDWGEKLIAPHVKIIIDNKGINLLEIVNEKGLIGYREYKACGYICALINVAQYFYRSVRQFDIEPEKPNYHDMETALRYLLGTGSWGDKIKLKIGEDTIMTKDIGKYVVEDNSSIHIELRPKLAGLSMSNAYDVIGVVRDCIEQQLERGLSVPVGGDDAGWGVGYL